MPSPRASFRFAPAPALALGASLALCLFSPPASAVGTRVFQLDSLDDLKGGDLSGVAVDSNGTVRAGLRLGAIPIRDANSVWSSVVLPDKSVLLGTGNDGKVYKVHGGQVSLVATTGELAVSSLALAWNGAVVAGTFPEGKLFRIDPNGKGGQATQLASLDGAEDVWGLAFDSKNKALYAATGPEGKLFRVDSGGRAQVHFDSDEPHLVSVAVDENGTVYTGSNGKGLPYRVTGPGRATVLYDFDADDVKAIAVAPRSKGGAIYAIANDYPDAFQPPKRNKSGPPAPQSTKPTHPGKGQLMRFGADGVAEELLDDDDTHYVSLALGDDGAPYVGTGAEGRVYTVDDNHVARLVADTDARQVGALVTSGPVRFVATSDPVEFHEVKGEGGADAVWTSKVLDAGLRASFGRVSWRSDGAVEVATRSGNTLVPDATWSAWSNDLAQPGDVTSPAARYVQIRARFRRDPKAILREVTLAFLTDNARAVVTSVDASPKGQTRPSLKTGIAASGGEPPKATTGIKLSWKIDNPDQDDLRYRLSYRPEGQTSWRAILKPGEKLTQKEYDWDTTALPEGTYRVRVEASDELANPPDRVKTHALESKTVLIDNTPPVFRSLAMQGRKLTGEIADGLGPIARIEVSVAGSEEWRPIFPSDGVFDEAAEAFSADVSSIVPAGAHVVAVRAYDSAGNGVTRDVDAR
jgi:hypothetical protein